jgi:hypothetical protein
MKPQVPEILVQLYKKIDPEADKLVVDLLSVPPIGRLYRDNTNGILWKVLTYSGDDMYEPVGNANLIHPVYLNDTKRSRDVLVILQAVNNEKLVMHLKPEVLESDILSLDHYKVVMKNSPRVPRFEIVEFAEDIEPAEPTKGVKTMSIDKTIRKLTDPMTTSLYILNVYPTPHGLAELLVEYLDNNPSKHPNIAKIQASWIPQDILALVPREALLNSQTFRRYLERGFILPITRGSAKRIKETPEYEVEAKRLVEMQPEEKMMRASRIDRNV